MVVGALAVGLKVGSCGRIIKSATQAADLRAAAARGKTAALAIDADGRRARGAAMGEELNHSGHGVCAVESALCASHDLDFVNVVQAEVGEIDGVTGLVNRRSIDAHFPIARSPTTAKQL